ncbi:hypothetical protein [Candidatus Symbiobacter mobilis]|uniref:Signal transduction protein n=1 Tax=Candidatus Symbiobacter mobilis CR TaxID=946483 RepID=U5N829_9BURK|nr:hypothetical protein [Candidatus Symbiobacter mobilis]AGX87716.1 signal transduction protein [Candidatus Symbiobacter mobilis CR]
MFLGLRRWWARLFTEAEAPDSRNEGNAQPVGGAASYAAAQAAPVVGSRCPLISSQGEIAGFEFRLGQDLQRRLCRRGERSAMLAHSRAVLASAQMVSQSGRIGLARLPADCVVHLLGEEVVQGVWIAIDRSECDPATTPDFAQGLHDALLHLRSQGAKLAWEVETGEGLNMLPDFVLARQGKQPMFTLLATLAALPPKLRPLPTLCTDIAAFEDLELALQSGVDYICGALAPTGSGADSGQTVSVSPEVGRIGQLLHQIVTGAETEAIVANIKSDVGLSYRLLQRLKTANLAHLEAGTSIDAAVLLLGRDELYRWLSLLLFQFAGKRRVSSALQEVALWRSHLMEGLAREQHEEAPALLFTLGLASMMSPILKISVQDVISTLHLHPHAEQALLAHAGPWQPYLALVTLLEMQELDPCPVLDHFGGAEHVTALSDEAWQWAWTASHAS